MKRNHLTASQGCMPEPLKRIGLPIIQNLASTGVLALKSLSVDHGIYTQQDPSDQPIFLSVVPGMKVIVKHDNLTGEKADKDWWMGQVIHCGGAARDPSIHNLFQIADVDSGVIRWVNAVLVNHILGAGGMRNSSL